MTTPSKTKPFMTSFVVHIEPEGKGMPRGFKDKAGNVRMHKNSGTARYEGKIAEAAAKHFPEGVLDCPLGIRILAVVARPKKLSEVWGGNNAKLGRVKGQPKHPPGLIWHTGKPDADKVLYAVMDALAPYVRNDSRFCDVNTVKAYAELDGRPRLEVTVWECEGEGPVEIPEEGSWELQRDLAECDEYAPVREALDAIGCHTITHKDEGGRTILKTYAPHEGGLSFDMGEEVKPAVITFEIEGEVLTEGQLQGRYVEAMEKCIRGEAWSELETIAVAMWVEYVHAQHKAGAMMDRLEGAPDREAYDKEVEAVFPDKGGESKATKAKQKATKPGRVDRRNLFA